MAGSNQGGPRSVAAIVALVLGIVAVVMSWMPIINNIAFVIGGIGLIIAIIGLVGVLRGKKAGKGLAIAALVVNIVSLAVVLGTQSMYSAAIDEAVNGPSATGTTQADDADDAAGDQSDEPATYTDLAPGTTVELENGLSITVDSVQTGLTNYDGSAVVCVHVTYVNNSDEQASYNIYDWKGEDAQGAQEYGTYYSEATEELNSGTLAVGGSVSGNLYFQDGTVKVVYFGTALSNEPTASWTIA